MKKDISLLLVEDSEEDATWIRMALRKAETANFKVDHAEWLAETTLCASQGASVYDTFLCRGFRGETFLGRLGWLPFLADYRSPVRIAAFTPLVASVLAAGGLAVLLAHQRASTGRALPSVRQRAIPVHTPSRTMSGSRSLLHGTPARTPPTRVR